MPQCHACQKPVEAVDGKVGRRDECPHCGRDLHCCHNCRFYEPRAYNECHEPVSDRVVDKEVSNFCDYFKLAGQLHPFEQQSSDAKAKLEALFRKK